MWAEKGEERMEVESAQMRGAAFEASAGSLQVVCRDLRVGRRLKVTARIEDGFKDGGGSARVDVSGMSWSRDSLRCGSCVQSSSPSQ